MTGNSSANFWTFLTVCWTAFPTVFRVDRHLLRNCCHPSSRFRPRCRSRLFTSGLSRSNLPEPLADFGVIGCAGGSVGDLLGAVSVVEPGVGAVSVLEEYFVLGTVPEVVAVGKDRVVLGFEDWFEEVVDEGSLARAEVLALGGLTVGAGAGAGVLAVALGAGAWAL